MPSCWATRLASSTSATEQQPESLGPPQSFMVAPTTSWPASRRSAAATDESTPPDMATSTCTSALPQAGHRFGNGLEGELDLVVGAGPSQRQPQARQGLVLGHTHGGQHV